MPTPRTFFDMLMFYFDGCREVEILQAKLLEEVWD